MTFNTEAAKSSRRPFTKVTLQMDFCGNEFGVLPCTASNSDDMKCYNTFGTCQDTLNYTKTTKDYIFSDILIKGTGYRVLVESVNTAPTELFPTRGISGRANATVVFKDSQDSDVGIDPYLDDRSYIASDQGTFWGKFISRNPHYYRRKMIIEYGFLGDNDEITNVETYTYLIDRVEYDNKSGKCKVIGKDVLMLSDSLKGKTPVASTGKLNVDITEVQTSLQIFTTDDTEYDQPSGRVFIGDEIIEYTGATYDASGNVLDLTGLTRGFRGTTADAHTNGDTVQRVRFWDNVRVDQVLRDILETDAGIDAEFIPFTDWSDEADTWLSAFNLTTDIVKPRSINELVGEIIEQCGLAVWSDDRKGGDIQLMAEAPLIGTALQNIVTITDAVIIEDTLTIKNDEKQRVSDIWFSHTQIDPTEDDDKIANYDVTDTIFDAESASENAYNKRQVREIYSRWLRESSTALTVGSRILRRFKETPKVITFELDASGPSLDTGDHFFLDSRHLQGDDGAAKITEFQVTSIDYMPKRSRYKIKALQFRFVNERNAFIAPNGTPDYSAASDAEKEQYAFISDSVNQTTDGLIPSEGNEPYLVI